MSEKRQVVEITITQEGRQQQLLIGGATPDKGPIASEHEAYRIDGEFVVRDLRAPPRRFRHLKRGTEYEYVGAATGQCYDGGQANITLEIEGQEFIVYRSVADGSLWVRPREEFWDGRFEEVKQ
jgi:hypothetical protein